VLEHEENVTNTWDALLHLTLLQVANDVHQHLLYPLALGALEIRRNPQGDTAASDGSLRPVVCLQ